MLKVEKISTGYGKKQILFDVSLCINHGETLLLTGGNGSGKSTMLKAIFGLLPLWSGNVYFINENISNSSANNFVKKGLVYIPQKDNFFEDMTVEENLKVSGHIYNKDSFKERIDRVYKLPKLYNLRKRKPFNLSGGERKLLVFGCALVHQPHLILFDEPLSGLDLENQRIISDLIIQCKSNISFLIIEHITRINFEFDKRLQMNMGKIVNN